MSHARLSFAPHVGVFVAATLFEDGLLAVCLAAGSRGDHRVIVVDTAHGFAPVSSFAIPSRARSGVTRITSAGGLLVTGDDHSVSGYHPGTGALAFRRDFESSTAISLLGSHQDRLLLSVTEAEKWPKAVLLSARDGGDASILDGVKLAGAFSVCLGPGGLVAIPSFRSVDVARPGAKLRTIPFEAPRSGVVDVAAFDATGERLAMGTRSGDVMVVDLASERVTFAIAFPQCVRQVGFLDGALWAMDGDGRLRVVSDDPSVPLSVDLGVATYGGMLAPDRSRVFFNDMYGRTFRAKALPGGADLFTTLPGFQCRSVAIGGDGALFAGDDNQVVRLDPATGRITKVLSVGPRTIRRLPGGALLFGGATIHVLAPGAKRPVRVGRTNDGFEISADGTKLVLTDGLRIEVWDLGTRARLERIDMANTWLDDRGEGIRTAHLGPDGKLLLHSGAGDVYRASGLGRGKIAHTLPSKGALELHPDGQQLYRIADRTLERTRLRGFRAEAPLRTPVDADISVIHFSPSGKKVVAFHRNGQVAILDVASGAGVILASPATSAAERAPGDLFISDLRTPLQCCFTPDERRVAWTTGGGLSFADVATGEIVGQVLLSTGATAFAATFEGAFDWTSSSGREVGPISAELTATLDGVPMDRGSLAQRRSRGLLRKLCG